MEYVDGQIKQMLTEEGVARYNESDSTFNYEYFLKDQLGNTRAVVDENGTLLQGKDYYAYGMAIENNGLLNNDNKYLYNGKEFQDDVVDGKALDCYDYGARMYDPVVARWGSLDPMAEKYHDQTPYNYVLNNPIVLIDPDGACPTCSDDYVVGATTTETNFRTGEKTEWERTENGWKKNKSWGGTPFTLGKVINIGLQEKIGSKLNKR